MKDKLKALGERSLKIRDHLNTEEATKHSLVLPFLIALGYDIYNPKEVVPEFIADYGTKKGEKIDYAIMQENNPVILIECKHCDEDLPKHSGQLFRYYSTIPGKKLAILTNGIKYLLFSDLDETNKLDEKPFFEFDITEIKDSDLLEIQKLSKSNLNMDNILGAASELKYTNELKEVINKELTDPSPDFSIFIASQIYEGRMTPNKRAFFEPLVKNSVKLVIDDIFTERLNRALSAQKQEKEAEMPEINLEEAIDSKIVTTEEELQSYSIIKAIGCKVIPASRITYKDYQSFFGINIDGRPSKTFCKIILTARKQQIIIINSAKEEKLYDITELDDIYNYAEELITALQSFEKTNILEKA